MVRQILWTLIIHDIPSFFMNWWIHNFVESYLIFFTFHTFFFQWECFTTNWTLIGCLSIMNSSLSKTRSTDVERMLLLSIMNCCNMFFQACGVIKTSITSCTWVTLLSFMKWCNMSYYFFQQIFLYKYCIYVYFSLHEWIQRALSCQFFPQISYYNWCNIKNAFCFHEPTKHVFVSLFVV